MRGCSVAPAATSTAATVAAAIASDAVPATTTAAVAEAVRAAVHATAAEIPAAIDAGNASSASALTISFVSEAVGHVQLGSANSNGNRVGWRGSMFSYLQAYHQTRRRPSLPARRAGSRTAAGA